MLRNNSIKSNIKIDKGFAILLTNDILLYTTDKNKDTLDQEYRFCESPGLGIKGGDAKWIKKTNNPSWVHQKQFNVKLPLRPEGYEIKWEKYEEIEDVENGIFKYCVVEV